MMAPPLLFKTKRITLFNHKIGRKSVTAQPITYVTRVARSMLGLILASELLRYAPSVRINSRFCQGYRCELAYSVPIISRNMKKADVFRHIL